MKNLIIVALFLSTSTFANEVCNGHILSKAQLEASILAETKKFQTTTDKLRKFMDDEFSQSQVAARTKTRMFNNLIQNSVDNAKLYNVFMPVFRDMQESFVIVQNLMLRKVELNRMLGEIAQGRNLSADDLVYLTKIGEDLPAGAKEATHLNGLLARFDSELEKRKEIMIENYDDYVSIEYSLDNLIKNPELKVEDKLHYEKLMSSFNLNIDRVRAKQFTFYEQLDQAALPDVSSTAMRKYFNADLALERDLWRHRAKQQWSGLYINILYKLRVHEQVLSFVTKRIPVGKAGFFKKIMGRISKTVTDDHMLNEYGARISSQVEPKMRAQTIEKQFENLLIHNSHSERADEFLVALARSDDGKIPFRELKEYASSKGDLYATMVKAMEKAEKDAAILGPLKIPEQKPSARKVALMTLTQIAVGMGILEYVGFIDLVPNKKVDDHIRELVDALKDPKKDPVKAKKALLEIEEKLKEAGAEPDVAPGE